MNKNRLPESQEHKGIEEQIRDIWDHIHTHFKELYVQLNSLVKELNGYDIASMKSDMTNSKKALNKKIDELIFEHGKSKGRIYQLEQENLAFRSEINEMQKQIGNLITKKVKELSTDSRESNGGSIGLLQYQDILLNFKDLKQLATALSNLSLSNDKSSLNRANIRASITRIITDDIDYDMWMKEMNDLSLEVQNNDNQFKSLFNKVSEVKNNMKFLKPNASFYIPNVGDPYDENLHILSSNKCKEERPISVVVYPGFYRGNQLDDKATVYTDE